MAAVDPLTAGAVLLATAATDARTVRPRGAIPPARIVAVTR